MSTATRNTRAEHDAKQLATLAANAALSAQICSQTSDGKIVLSRSAHAATFETVAQANAWLGRDVKVTPHQLAVNQ